MAKKITNIGFVLPVESISRKFARRADKVNNKPTGVKAWIGAATSMVANKYAYGVAKNYIVVRKAVRSTVASAAERARQARFAAVSVAVANRMQDLTQITQDQIAFIAQRDQPGGKKSMKSYLWSLELTIYDAAHPQG